MMSEEQKIARIGGLAKLMDKIFFQPSLFFFFSWLIFGYFVPTTSVQNASHTPKDNILFERVQLQAVMAGMERTEGY